jgi:hypothetical protein
MARKMPAFLSRRTVALSAILLLIALDAARSLVGHSVIEHRLRCGIQILKSMPT